MIAVFICHFAGLSARDRLEDLKVDIDQIILEGDPHVHLGLEVISLQTGEVLYQRNARQLFIPASIQKIIVCAAALDQLGAHYRFETQVLRDTQGNLYLRGAGDPSLDHHALEELVRAIDIACPGQPVADLIADHSLFDDITLGPGWMWDEGAHYWNSPIDALLVNHSCVGLSVQPSMELLQPPRISVWPPTDYVFIDNRAVTTEQAGKFVVERSPIARENKIKIDGVLAPSAPLGTYRIPVEAPHLYTLNLFRRALQAQGIEIQGSVHVGKTPPDAQVIARHRSQPLSVLIVSTLKDSDNLSANCLFKKVGEVVVGAPGTWQNGSQAVRQFLQERVHLDVHNIVMLDGDGESRYNLLSPHHMIELLCWTAHQFTFGPEMMAAMPIAGMDGTLKNRMTDPAVRGRVRAKTGSMTGVSSLCGYAKTKDGETLAFALMINGFVKPSIEYKNKIEDRICQTLAEFSR